MKLNLASGTDLREPPWLNLDVVPKWPIASRGCDILWDARYQAIPVADGSVDEIYGGYLLLHLAPCNHERVMREIVRVLQPGGCLVLGEVDMTLLLPRFLAEPENVSYRELIWGEQGTTHGEDLAAFDKHCCGFTEESLRRMVEAHGFVNPERIQVHNAAVWYELTIRCYKP